MSKQGTETIKIANDSIAALAALYQGEKTDASYVFNTAMAMMGIAVAYLIGAIPFVGNLGHGPIGWLFLLLLPFPLWLIAAFHSLMTLNAMSHGISVQIIERALFRASELPIAQQDLVGSAAGDKIMDITQSRPAHKLTTVVVYGGVAFLVIGFTAYTLYSANGRFARVECRHQPSNGFFPSWRIGWRGLWKRSLSRQHRGTDNKRSGSNKLSHYGIQGKASRLSLDQSMMASSKPAKR